MDSNDKTRPPQRRTPDPVDASEAGDEEIEAVPLYRRKRVVIPLLLLIVLAVGAGWYWYVSLRDFISTDDAYIDADRATVSSKILGRIDKLYVDEGATVAHGDTLARLDNSDQLAQEKQARASLDYAQEAINPARVALAKAEEDFQRAEVEYKGGTTTKEQHDHARQALDAARADVSLALTRVTTAHAQLDVVETQLHNTVINSPIDGKVAKRWVLEGDVVQAGQPIFSVYNVDSVWVTSNFEETNIGRIRLNDPVEISVDAYPHKTFRGRVIQLGSYTASEFSLIPPNNASGNFTKVTQRVPVKISVDGQVDDPGDRTPLLPGMSVDVRIKVQ